ncbi:MAG: hypothetical protein H6739_08360 [Alphaproteobacteria bacterium]|nr:hypothetical protein [Alphaproteobacteria bacterium]
MMNLFYDGGPFMLVLLIGAMFAGGLGLVRALVAPRLSMPALTPAVGLGCLALGLFATHQGVLMVFQAIASVSADLKSELLAESLNAAVLPGKLSALLAAGLLLLHGLAGLRERREAPRALALTAAALVGVAGLAMVAAVLASWVTFDTVAATFDTTAPASQEQLTATAARLARANLAAMVGAGVASGFSALGGAVGMMAGFVGLIRADAE